MRGDDFAIEDAQALPLLTVDIDGRVVGIFKLDLRHRSINLKAVIAASHMAFGARAIDKVVGLYRNVISMQGPADLVEPSAAAGNRVVRSGGRTLPINDDAVRVIVACRDLDELFGFPLTRYVEGKLDLVGRFRFKTVALWDGESNWDRHFVGNL